MGAMTVTDVDLNRDGIPDVVQQPQFGIALKGRLLLLSSMELQRT